MEELAIDIMKEQYPYDKEVIDEILELILDTVCSSRKTIGIAGEQRPIDIVKSRLKKRGGERRKRYEREALDVLGSAGR